jgi:hypothetical protein
MLQTLRSALTPNEAHVRRRTWRGWDRASEFPYTHHVEAAEAAKRKHRNGDDQEAVAILEWCLSFLEREASAEYFMDIPPAYYEQLADIHSRAGRPDAVVAVLERYTETVRSLGGTPRSRVLDRLERARTRATAENEPA